MNPSRILLFLLILPMAASCSLFETRDPEEPGTTTGPPFIQTDRPENVIDNLVNAVTHMNTDHYQRLFSEADFTYRPSSDAQSNNPGLWQGWGYQQEVDYFRAMRSETEGRSGHGLQFDEASLVNLGENEEQFETNYRLTVNHNRGPELLPTEARGRLIITMKRDESGDWAIHSWTDRSNGTDFTWSDFRYIFLN
ncbi:hypothetical protein QA596_06125 [Balneolales bacterium ANBcel1]|nr:hypothetical protein [Balneolales bacterium ANBcel1]